MPQPDWAQRLGHGPNRTLIVAFLEAAEQRGCTIVVPDAVKDTYVNVVPPAPPQRGRVVCVQTRTGSIEFQTGSWARLGSPGGFRHLAAGEKAARTLGDRTDLDAVIAALDSELRQSGEAGSGKS